MALFRKDPFSLMTFHRVLIGTAIAGCLAYAASDLIRNIEQSPVGALMRAGTAVLLALGLVFYYRSIRGKNQPGDPNS